MKNNIAIQLTNISKRYYLHNEKPTLIENLNPFKVPQEFWALKNVNLTIKKGERIGITGPNGSGKTTLLKIIAGITQPTTGTVKTYGRVISLIELEAGFNPELTGYQNIFINGTLLGLKISDIKQVIKKIIRFANIGNFIYSPLYTYSEGMKMRLGFSIAIHTHPNILILDEQIGVGDKEFQEKSFNKVMELSKKYSTTLICTSHLDWILKQMHVKLIPISSLNQNT